MQFTVQYVKITNREGVHGDRLKEFAVYVDDQDRDPAKRLGTVCKEVDKIERGATRIYKCNQPITGRYVSVVNSRQDLTICELEVYADLTTAAGNIARGKPAEQKSTYQTSSASRAVDGDRDANFNSGHSCSHTFSKHNEWLRVDLQADYKVTSVYITNRAGSYGNRLKDFSVFVDVDKTEPGKGVKCVQVKTIDQGATVPYTCDKPIVGRYVTVFQPGPYLTICELEVFGTLVKATPAIGQTATPVMTAPANENQQKQPAMTAPAVGKQPAMSGGGLAQLSAQVTALQGQLAAKQLAILEGLRSDNAEVKERLAKLEG